MSPSTTAPLGAAILMNDPRDRLVYTDAVRARLERHARWTTMPFLPPTAEGLASVEALFTGWGAPVLSNELLNAMPRLRAVFHAAGSVRGITGDAFWSREIPIVSAASANAVPVAQFAHAHVMLALKHAFLNARQVRSQRHYADRMRIPGAYHGIAGIVSLGEIGRRVAEKLVASEVEVIAYDPYADTAEWAAKSVRLVSLDELFSMAQAVSIHAPLLAATRGMIDAPLLGAMPEGATLINTARGTIVNESDLIATLHERPDLTAVLDVTVGEPPEHASALYDLPNLVLTGHIAGSLGTECERLGELVADEFERFATGEPMVHEIAPHLADLRA